VAGRPIHFVDPGQARQAGIETVYQTLAIAPSLDIASNLYLGREKRRHGLLGSILRILDHRAMRSAAKAHLDDLGIMTIQNPAQAVETLSGGQRQAVAVARAAAFDSRIVIMDEPTAALGVRESRAVVDLILQVRARGLAVILVSHDMPLVFEIADRIHIQRLGRRIGVVAPESHAMTDAVAIMTGAAPPPASAPQP
jgi:fructose transport system ATP-binding protein